MMRFGARSAIGKQDPFSEHLVAAVPTVGTSHVTDEVAVRIECSIAELPASRFWVVPVDPGTTDTRESRLCECKSGRGLQHRSPQ